MFFAVEPGFVHSSGMIRMSFPETNADFSLDAFLDSLGTDSVFVSPGWTTVNPPPQQQQQSHSCNFEAR
jgi:hypothetical protein